MHLLVYSFFVKVVFVLRFLLNFLEKVEERKTISVNSKGSFSFAVEGDIYFSHWLSFVIKIVIMMTTMMRVIIVTLLRCQEK